jgi:hypothetical protein
VHEKGAEAGDQAIGNAQVGRSLATAIQDEELMPSERGFRDEGTKATRFYKPDDGDDQMNEKDEDVVHAGIVSKSQKIPEFRPNL